MKLMILYPKTCDEITVEQYQKYCKLFVDDEQHVATVEELFKIFTNVNPRDLPQNDVERIAKHISDAISQCDDYKGFTPVFEFGGIKYGFIPNLDKMSFGEYEDLINTLKDVSTFHNALEIMYRPVVNQFDNLYQIAPYAGYENKIEFRHMPITYFLGAMVFFYRLTDALATHTKNYFHELTIKQNASVARRLENDLRRNGVNIANS